MEIIKRYCIKPNFVLRRIAGEYAIVPVDVESELTNAVMQPNETAAFIWQTFQQPMTEAEVVEKVKQEFDAPEEVNQLPRCKHSSTVLGSYVTAHSTCLSLLLPQD